MDAYLARLGQNLFELLWVGAIFAVIGLLVRRPASADKRAEAPTNLIIAGLDAALTTPLVLLFVPAVVALFPQTPLGGLWDEAGVGLTALTVLLLGDLIGYWRHRIQHTAALWPAHAVHHSDRALTWITLLRMHPVDRLSTACDTVILLLLGFPPWALALNNVARHYYGYLIHADLPWTLGKFELILNSPAMHRWHHSREVHGKNFATLFSMWDRMFGTFYSPGPCEGPLGVDADMGSGAAGQYVYPFKAWGAALTRRLSLLRTSST